MRYIDKNTHLQAGHDITDRYLDSTCKVDDSDENYYYQNVDYDGSFGKTGAKDAMMRLALGNQENFCCYCMRDLHLQNQRITLEHIIPQSCDKAKFNLYIGLNVSPLTADNVVRTGDFTSVPNVSTPPRPHTVTFENLVASCDGTFPDKDGTSQCCNHKRGDNEVYPMFYVATVGDEITYMDDGSMQPSVGCAHQMEYRRTIENVRLNCQNLKDIRRLWHLFDCEEFQVLVSCLDDKNLRNRTLITVLFKQKDLVERDSDILTKFMKDDYWKTFLLYHWFHHKI